MTHGSDPSVPSDGGPGEQDLAAENVQSTNQPRTEPVPPSPADDAAPSSGTADADDISEVRPSGHQFEGDTDEGADVSGAPAGTVPDVQAAPGTSESLDPVEGVRQPDVGPGGDDLNTARTPAPGRTTQAGDGG